MLLLHQLEPEAFRPLRRVEYERLVELGVFGDERVELLQGVLVRMSPQGSRHAWVIRQLTQRLMLALAGRALVQSQLPFAASDSSEPEPEPDVAVVPMADYRYAHPDRAMLIVEVPESSLRSDRRAKLPIYAECGVPEVWIVNLEESVVEVYSEPHGDTWRTKRSFARGDTIALGAFPDVTIAAADLLP